MGTPLLWVGFLAFVAVMLALDLGVFTRRERAHTVRPREALTWSLIWVGLAIVFDLGIWHFAGPDRALEFLTGYLIEKALSVDNLFVFLVIFSYFKVPPAHQRRVLVWGILGAVILRAVFILAGAALIRRFEPILYALGAFLMFTGARLVFDKGDQVDPAHSRVVRWFRRLVPMVPEYREGHFVVSEGGRTRATLLLLVLVTVETTDVIFAVDSIPAIFAVTRDPFIVFTSNIFAILGLRALYFLLADMMERFRHLKVGLGIILAFVGAKMLVAEWYEVPIGASLAVIATILALTVFLSLRRFERRPV